MADFQLANGATVLRHEWIEREKTPGTNPYGIVLAQCEAGLVTWDFNKQRDGSITCNNGHYFNGDQRAADDDYDDRVRSAERQRARMGR